MSQTFSWFLAVSLAIATTGQARAHTGNRIFEIWELPTADLPDLHDDTLEDWEENFPGLPLDYHHFTNLVNRAEDPADLAFRVFLAWHNASQTLYMAVECVDNQLTSQGDLLDVRIDGDHSGGRFLYWGEELSEEEMKRLNESQAQRYGVWEYSPEGFRQRHSGAAEHWATQPPWNDVGGFQIGEAPSHAVVEMKITSWDDLNWVGPEQSRRSELKGGRIIGLDLWLSDIDEWLSEDPQRANVQNWYRLAPNDPSDHGFSASYFVDAELIPCQVGDCSEAPKASAVQSNTWARIKASFR